MISANKRYFIKKPYDVIFYYPQHFNRNQNGENPYFTKLISSCIKNNFSYLLLEEPDGKTNFPRSEKATKFDFWFYFIIILRKISPSLLFRNDSVREKFIGKLISVLSFNAFKANTYITISNSMIDMFSGLNAKASTYDLQHGIIYSWHWGYFDNQGNLNDFLKSDQIKFLVYGKGFKDIFFKNSDNLKFKAPEAVEVIGNVLAEEKIINEVDFSNILYTLQITNDISLEEINNEKSSLLAFINHIQPLFLENNLSLILKSHPRFNDASFLDSIATQFSFVTITKKEMTDLASEIFLHLTKSSTSIFDLALNRIPSLLLENKLGLRIYKEEYKYPIDTVDICNQINEYLEHKTKYQEDQQKVKVWHSKFYEPYNENLFVKIITRNGRKN